MAVKTGQRQILLLFKKPPKAVIWGLYYEKGLSMPDVAKACGVSSSSVQNWMNEWGWPRRERGVQIVAPPRPTEAANG